MKFGVIGSGSWGTALVKILTYNGNEVIWCVRSEKMAEHIRVRHHNPKYLSSVYFNRQSLSVTTDPSLVLAHSDAVVLAMPSGFAASYLDPIKHLLSDKIIVSAVKGMLPQYKMLINEYLKEQSAFNENQYVSLMGPCHAEEVAAEKLSYLTFSSFDISLAEKIAACFKTPFINTIINSDVYGVQYASVLKNIYALGSGILHGLNYGDNFQSVFVANAAHEMKTFLEACAVVKKASTHAGCKATNNYEASVYLGDLLVTCYSLFSRNRTFGNMIGKGYSVEATRLEMKMVAEGYPASKSIYELNKEIMAPMPIAHAIYKILWENLDPALAFSDIESVLI
jgi:glycerol-3-phosphate dehydrogenase (NAD(P)+)